MNTRAEKSLWVTLGRLRRIKRVRSAATLGLVVLGPVLALATYLVLGPLGRGGQYAQPAAHPAGRSGLHPGGCGAGADQVGRLIAARRAKSAGSRLHLRLTGVFALLALIPTVMVAVFAGLTVNVGLEGWFSDRVRQVVGNSLAAAEAYEEEQRIDLAEDAQALASSIDQLRRLGIDQSDSELLGDAQRQIQRGLREAYLIDGTGEIRARGDRSYLFDFEKPRAADIDRAAATGAW